MQEIAWYTRYTSLEFGMKLFCKIVGKLASNDRWARQMIITIVDNNRHLTEHMVHKAVNELDEAIYGF